MITISETLYREIAQRLREKINEKPFFNGSVEYDAEEFYSTLTCTLIICRDPDSGQLLSAMPVWWEFHLHQADGEVLTDFCWSELARFLEA